jgi:4-amino-4-deoxy-L-arabinose transferase-like glycosyltransferase
MLSPEEFPPGFEDAPLWHDPNIRKTKQFAENIEWWRENYKNHEMGSFPVYYMVAGGWCAIGRTIGMREGHLIYWIRFLNVPLFALFVWVCYLIGRAFFPDRALQRIGLPLIAAFFPQDVFFSINNDAISPLLFAIAFLMLVRIYLEERPLGYYIFAGLAVAATFLVKVPNVAVLILAGLVSLLKLREILVSRRFEKLMSLAVLLAVTTVPIVFWLARNYFVLGDVTASAAKIKYLGWSVKPVSEWWSHPIFTAEGFCYFLGELIRKFWRGEFVWYGREMAWRSMDAFYIVSTGIFLVVCGFNLIRGWSKSGRQYRFIIMVCFGLMVFSVLFLVMISLPYDFGKCIYPSREKPYFVSGRLIGGVLVPFLILYLEGLGQVFSRVRSRIYPLLAVAVICAAMTCSEILLALGVFGSLYNWFHLW